MGIAKKPDGPQMKCDVCHEEMFEGDFDPKDQHETCYGCLASIRVHQESMKGLQLEHLPYIYVAARFPSQPQAKELADKLRTAGYRVTSRWLKEEPGLEATVSDHHRAKLAHMDVRDVERAHVLVLLNPEALLKVGGGGCHVETGIALALEKPIFVLGPASNIFHYLPQVHICETVEQVVEGIRKEFAPA